MRIDKFRGLLAANEGRLLIMILFVLGAGVRLFDLTDEPLDFHPTRQLRSAIIARAMYYEGNPEIPTDEVEFARKQAAQTGLIEPPVLEFLSAAGYRLAGEELVWIGRLFSIGFWLLGGLVLCQLAMRIGGRPGAIAALSVYLLLPFGVIASRTLMPDPLMVALMVTAVWALYRWEEERSWKTALLTGAVTGLAILVKSVAGIILFPAFAALILGTMGIKAALKDRQVWAIGGLAALPTAGFYVYGIFIDGRLGEQFAGRFFPELYTNPALYVNWLLNIEAHFSLAALALACAGIALARQDKVRWLLLGWWGGYILYGFIFPHHIWTHSYYHLPLVPILALSLAPLAGRLSELIEAGPRPGFNRGLILAGLGVWAAFNLWSAQDQLEAVDYRVERAMWEEIGGMLDENPGAVVALTDDYENGLKFYGLTAARHWPAGGDLAYWQLSGGGAGSFEKRWGELTEGAAYFVVTDFEELANQPELGGVLGQTPVYWLGEEYRIYALGGE